MPTKNTPNGTNATPDLSPPGAPLYLELQTQTELLGMAKYQASNGFENGPFQAEIDRRKALGIWLGA